MSGMRGLLGSWCVFGLLLGCGGQGEDEFTYGKAEMEAQVVGTWTGSWLFPDSPASTLTLVVDSRNDPSLRRASCSRQEFSAPGSSGQRPLCGSSSGLAVQGTLTVADGSLETTDLVGSYEISSLNLGPGALYLDSADQSVGLWANQNDDLTWSNCTARVNNQLVACSLEALE